MNCIIFLQNLTQFWNTFPDTHSPPEPEVTAQVSVNPQESTVRRGDGFRLTCKVELVGSGDRSTLAIRWSKLEGSLPVNAAQNGGVLSVPTASPTDSGIYVCTVSTSTGFIQQSQSRVTVLAYRSAAN